MRETQSHSTFGGVFAPLAQYPGASYATMLRHKGSQELPFPASPNATESPKRRDTLKDGQLSMAAPPLFSCALLLVDAESNAVVDRRALRDVGIAQVRVMTSGLQAAKLLAAQIKEESQNPVDVVFCHPKLADMSAVQWVEMIRRHPRLVALPILAVAGNTDQAAGLHALAEGYSDILVRPYSHQSLRQSLQSLARLVNTKVLEQGQAELQSMAFDKALSHFERCQSQGGNAQSHFEIGLRSLQERQWDAAIQAFQKALLQISLKGEAELGLAAAWRGKGDKGKYHHFLSEAGRTFARASQWHRARMAYARLLLTAPGAESPFLATAEGHIRAGRYDEAAAALAAGFDMSPGAATPERLGKALLFTENPAFSLDKVQRALGATPLAAMASSLGESMQRSMEEAEKNAEERRMQVARQRAEAKAAAARIAHKNAVVPGIALAELDDEDEEAAMHRDIIPGRASLLKGDTGPSSLVNQQEDVLAPLRPLRESEAESKLFASIPGLNEAMTVIKVTWKLLK